MQAFEIEVMIPEDHRLTLPAGVPTGPAKLILVSPSHSADGAQSKMVSFRNRQKNIPLAAGTGQRSALEIERYIEELRGDWD